MRLELRRKLYPYQTLGEVADALDVAVPRLKRHLRDLETCNGLSLETLAHSLGATLPQGQDDLFVAFHRRNLCLVCGSDLHPVEGRQAGWGEFQQCLFCGFSVHENADFQRSREVAEGQLKELRATMERAQKIFAQRKKQGLPLLSDGLDSGNV